PVERMHKCTRLRSPARVRREGVSCCRRVARCSIYRRLHRRRRLMALVDNLFKGWGGVLLGFGACIAAPSLFPDAGAAVRPLAKRAVKGVLAAAEALKAAAAEATEQVNDFVAEVRAESGNGDATRPA